MWQQSWQSWKVQVSYNKGGEWDWYPSPQSHGLYSEFLDGSGLWVSSCQLKVSSCQPRVSLWADTLNSLAALSCRCLTGHLSRASWQLEMSPKFLGHLSIISWMDTWISWNCSWMRYHPDSYTGCSLVAGFWMLRVAFRVARNLTCYCTDMHNLFCQFFRFGLYSPLSVKKNPPGFLSQIRIVENEPVKV